MTRPYHHDPLRPWQFGRWRRVVGCRPMLVFSFRLVVDFPKLKPGVCKIVDLPPVAWRPCSTGD